MDQMKNEPLSISGQKTQFLVKSGESVVSLPSSLGMHKQKLEEFLNSYGQAWVNQNVPQLDRCFTEDAIYHERVLEEPLVGIDEIREYWRMKVCEEQKDIGFRVREAFYDPSRDTAIVEWKACFTNRYTGVAKRMREIAVLQFREDKVQALREFWCSEAIVNG